MKQHVEGCIHISTKWFRKEGLNQKITAVNECELEGKASIGFLIAGLSLEVEGKHLSP